jgi:L-asparaginase
MKNILLIQTGGTIAMSAKGDGVELNPDAWSGTLTQRVPQLGELAIIHTIPLFFEDSSDLNHTHWIKLAECIRDNYEDFDGFVILHGTDTMAYTASALSFALQNLAKPVIFTGSQVPLASIRSDARRNLINAIEMATTDLVDVAICFNDHVYRGNRATKLSIGDFDAFGSPNLPPLATIGLEIKKNFNPNIITGSFGILPVFSNELLVLTVFPSLNTHYLMELDVSKLRAIVVRAFGSGNVPTKGAFNLLSFLERCANEGVIVAMVSQAAYDAVNLTKYPAGRAAAKAGAISAGDMTLEATLTKMMWLLGNHTDKTEIELLFQSNLAGELTTK